MVDILHAEQKCDCRPVDQRMILHCGR